MDGEFRQHACQKQTLTKHREAVFTAHFVMKLLFCTCYILHSVIFWGLQLGERPYCSPRNSKTMIGISYRAATCFQVSCLAETSSCCKPALIISSRAIHCTQQPAIQRKFKCKPFARNQRTQIFQATEFGHPELYELH